MKLITMLEMEIEYISASGQVWNFYLCLGKTKTLDEPPPKLRPISFFSLGAKR